MTFEEIHLKMKNQLSDILPDTELRRKAELAFEINQLKQERNALILGHNYMEPALFCSVCDYTGDSLELSRKAAQTDKEVIVFCGVEFMAETAKILSPEKTVLLPGRKAGCSLAEGITAEDIRSLKRKYPGIPVVTYVNTYADVKAECDLCCTSGNAAAVAESLDADTLIFLPDEYLARNVARQTGKTIVFPTKSPEEDIRKMSYQMIGWHARCEVHEQFTTDHIADIRKRFPKAAILAHPECSPRVTEAADFAGSTSAMIQFVSDTAHPQYLLLTECAMADNVAAANPDKEILHECRIRCPHMERITLENTLDALKYNQYVIELPEEIRVKALGSVERMLAIR